MKKRSQNGKPLPVLRLLQDPPLDGPANMARDEVLLNRVGEEHSIPTLRLYQWEPPTISLGYFQRYADYEALPGPAGDLAVVRRLTGGGAILHDQELTYSLTLPIDHALLCHGPTRLYELAHDAVAAALAGFQIAATRCGTSDDSSPARGPFFCFQRRHAADLLVGTDKVAGSAQRRTRHAVLQHGSIVLSNRYTQQHTAAMELPFKQSVQIMRAEFSRQFAMAAHVDIIPGDWAKDELTAAKALAARYRNDDFTRRR